MNCPSCGSAWKEGNRFCTKCGYQLKETTPVTSTPVQYTQPYQQVVYVPVVQKTKPNVIVFNLIAFILMIVSYFLPLASADIFFSRAEVSMFDITRAAFEINRYASYWGVEENTIYIILVIILFFLLVGVVAAFSRGRVISTIVGILMMLFFVPLCAEQSCECAGSIGFALSGLFYFLGGCFGI